MKKKYQVQSVKTLKYPYGLNFKKKKKFFFKPFEILTADIVIQKVSPVLKSNIQAELIHSTKANLALLQVLQYKHAIEYRAKE